MSMHQAPERPATRPQAERGIGAFGTLSVTCTVVTALNTLYILLVAMGNVTDYETNLAFVRHVLAMDTTNFGAPAGTELDPDVIWRAVTPATAQTVAYLAIIAWQWLTAAVLSYATVLWVRSREPRRFDAPRRWSTIGYLMLVLLFMGGFITIGGGWFQMWRSADWNGLDPAFRNTMLALFGLVLVHLPSSEWESIAAPEPGSMPAQ